MPLKSKGNNLIKIHCPRVKKVCRLNGSAKGGNDEKIR